MAKRIIRLTESDLNKLIKKIISEQTEPTIPMGTDTSVKSAPTSVPVQTAQMINAKLPDLQVTPQEVQQAQTEGETCGPLKQKLFDKMVQKIMGYWKSKNINKTEEDVKTVLPQLLQLVGKTNKDSFGVAAQPILDAGTQPSAPGEMNEGPILALGGLLFFVLFVAWGILTKNRNGNGTGYRSYNHCQVGRVRLDY